MAAPELSDTQFLRLVSQAGPHLMWFLGAGASRSSGLPTATDIIWDLKRKLYCAQQNQDIQAHDVSNKAVQGRIQSYFDGKGFPPAGDPREYSFYFERTFGDDYAAQQAYLNEALATSRISSTLGHRALAALLAMGRTRVIFTTNFDEVVETAYAAMAGKHLATFHLEGAYAAIDALNADQFPFYAKVHGDFRYRSVKNLAKDLLRNDEEIQKCLVAAATRFGMIVAGYSGRDENVMAMFRKAIDQNNAFPHGLWWSAPSLAGIAPNVRQLMDHAASKNIKCGLVQAGPFDEMLSKIWRHTANKPSELDSKVRSAAAKPVSIALPGPGKRYPLLRTNALLITKLPGTCGTVDYDGDIDMREVRSKVFERKPACTLAYSNRIMMYWGAKAELEKVVDAERIRSSKEYVFDDLVRTVDESSFVKAFVEETIARALLHGKPVNLRRDGRTWYAVVKHDEATHNIYRPLRLALGKGTLASAHDEVFGLPDVYWSEAVSMRIEERNGALWLMLRPDVWISPLQERQNATEFLIAKKLKRYNSQAYEILSAWIEILLGSVGKGERIVTAFPDTDFSAQFEISTRTAYSRPSGAHA